MPRTEGVPTISVKELKTLRDQKSPHALIDVREPDENQHCRIEGAILIPLGQLPGRVGEVPKGKPIVVHCHHGGRSARATELLLSSGFKDVKNLSGGIDAWSCEIDTSVPRY